MEVWNIYVFAICVLLKLSASFGMNCTFDNGWCKWNQNSGNWTRSKNATSTVDVEPSGDHTTGGGYYIYANASNVPNGSTSNYTSPNVTRGNYCLSLWYFMVGDNVNSLKIIKKAKQDSVLFAKYDRQGPNWMEAKVGLSSKMTFQIVVQANFSKKNGFGFIGVDDIVISPGLCSLDCTFNDGFCVWKPDDTGLRWSRGRYAGSSLNLTYLSSDKDYYLNIFKVEGINSVGKATLSSPWQQSGPKCLTFQTFLFGNTANVLNVYIKKKNTAHQLMLSVKNISYTTLHMQYIDLSITVKVKYKIKFVGEVASGQNGNILIDNITSINAQCKYGCESSPCENGATCLDRLSANYTCMCFDDWSGRTCNESAMTVLRSGCVSSPCENGATCMDEVSGNYTCMCFGDWSRHTCNESVTTVLRSGCESSPCENGATCIDGVSGNYTCMCFDDWSGHRCNESATTVLRSERTQIPIVYIVTPASTACVIIIAGVVLFLWRRRVRERRGSVKKKENEVFEAEGEIVTGVDNNGYALAEQIQRDQADTSVATAHNEPDTDYTYCRINEQVPKRSAVHNVNYGLVEEKTDEAATQARYPISSNDESTLYANVVQNTVSGKVAAEMNEESSYDTLGAAELKNVGHGGVKEGEDRDYDTFETVKCKSAGNSTMQDKQIAYNNYDHIGRTIGREHNTESADNDYSHVTVNY